MKRFKKTSYFVLLLICTVLAGCNSGSKKSEKSNGDNGNEPEIEYRISTYEIHISGGKSDGQTFSGSFPNDEYHGQGQLLSKVAKNISKDIVHINFKVEKNEGAYIGVDANLVLDENGKLLPLADFRDVSNYRNESTITFQIGDNIEDTAKGHQFASKSGTVSMSNLKLEQDETTSLASMIDCDVSFEAEFIDMELGTGETPQAVPASIKGEFHIKSIRNNLED